MREDGGHLRPNQQGHGNSNDVFHDLAVMKVSIAFCSSVRMSAIGVVDRPKMGGRGDVAMLVTALPL